jgi:hypothetical protein
LRHPGTNGSDAVCPFLQGLRLCGKFVEFLQQSVGPVGFLLPRIVERLKRVEIGTDGSHASTNLLKPIHLVFTLSRHLRMLPSILCLASASASRVFRVPLESVGS